MNCGGQGTKGQSPWTNFRHEMSFGWMDGRACSFRKSPEREAKEKDGNSFATKKKAWTTKLFMTDSGLQAQGAAGGAVPDEGTPERRAWAMRCSQDRAEAHAASLVAQVLHPASLTQSAPKAPPAVTFMHCDTLTAVAAVSGSKAILDMAARRAPPKETTSGTSQEEELCRRTSLGFALRACKAKALYPLRDEHVLVVRGVSVLAGPGPAYDFLSPSPPEGFTVIAAAAPKQPHLEAAIQRVLACACHEGVDTLILGAWGCGARHMNPVHVATAFKQCVQACVPCPPHIVFAIPGAGTLATFSSILT